MKKGFVIVGIVLTLSLPVSASDSFYKLTKSTYPIEVDNTIFKSTNPILNYNGTTYLPLREVSNVTGSKIEWDSINKKIIINTIKNEPVPTIPLTIPSPISTPTPIKIPANYDKIKAYVCLLDLYKQYIDLNRMLNNLSSCEYNHIQMIYMNSYNADKYKNLSDMFDGYSGIFNSIINETNEINKLTLKHNIDESSFTSMIINNYKDVMNNYSLAIVKLGSYAIYKKQEDNSSFSYTIQSADNQNSQILKNCNDRYEYYLNLIMQYNEVN